MSGQDTGEKMKPVKTNSLFDRETWLWSSAVLVLVILGLFISADAKAQSGWRPIRGGGGGGSSVPDYTPPRFDPPVHDFNNNMKTTSGQPHRIRRSSTRSGVHEPRLIRLPCSTRDTQAPIIC